MDRDKPDVIQPTTDETRASARHMISDARHASLAVIEPHTGHPLCSRVGLATGPEGTPLILVSALAAHTPALLADPRCSLLVGDPGKGDPLAHPRLTLVCLARSLPRDGEAHSIAREHYLEAHPKAGLYIDLPDFRFFELRILRASLNGGFGRAFLLTADDLVSAR